MSINNNAIVKVFFDNKKCNKKGGQEGDQEISKIEALFIVLLLLFWLEKCKTWSFISDFMLNESDTYFNFSSELFENWNHCKILPIFQLKYADDDDMHLWTFWTYLEQSVVIRNSKWKQLIISNQTCCGWFGDSSADNKTTW